MVSSLKNNHSFSCHGYYIVSNKASISSIRRSINNSNINSSRSPNLCKHSYTSAYYRSRRIKFVKKKNFSEEGL